MAQTYEQLLNQFIFPSEIPHDLLYDSLLASREDLANRLRGLGTEAILQMPVVQEVRRRCKSDLFWMARYFTWETNPVGADRPVSENLITEEEYRIVCDFFVRKDDRKTITEQDTIKNRLLLWPRGGFKSTIDVVDVVQWILNFPDIRILFLTGADDLATGFVKETKGHFTVQTDSLPTLMGLFFPEFCIPEDQRENEFQFTCPAWALKKLKRKEPTVLASSVGSTKSGWHFEVIKGDDPVTDKNTESPEQCAKISKQLSLSKKLLRPGGYYNDYIGTRYDDEDHYGVMLEKNVGDVKTFSKPCVTLMENATTATKILIGRGIVIKQEIAAKLLAEGKKVEYPEAGEEGCDLLIPNVMGFSWLMQQYRENEDTFEGQINQNPRPTSSTTFERKDLVAATVRFDQMPWVGAPISQTWDFAYSVRKGRDFTTGSSAMWNDKGCAFVYDLIRQRFKPNDQAQAVVDFARKAGPALFIIGIEDASGSQNLQSATTEKARQTGNEHVLAVCSRIHWIPPEHAVDAKRTRMATMHPPLMEGRLKFANYIPFLEELYKEFERCMTSKSARNDIPDVISQQLQYASRVMRTVDKDKISTWTPGEADWNMVFEEGDAFGRPGMGTPPPMVDIKSEPELGSEQCIPGMPNVLGGGLIG